MLIMSQTMNTKAFNSLTPHLIGKWTNTYTYTKAMGEATMEQLGSDLPVAIVRPSMVCSAWREPLPGWTEA
jgi:fatty acyl-CoA reductase